jgi:hypothetical protein
MEMEAIFFTMEMFMSDNTFTANLKDSVNINGKTAQLIQEPF